MITITAVGGRMSGVGDLARLSARATSNGGHGNGALPMTQVGPSIPARPRLAKDGQPYPMQADATQWPPYP